MVQAVFASKYTIPPQHAGLIPRPGLIKRLDEIFSHKLTLVSAPAGYGKTSLLSAWAFAADCTPLWIALEESDNDLSLFLAALAASLEVHLPEIAAPLTARLQALPLPRTEEALLPLLNGIAKARIPVVLILDDYHVIHEQPVHTAIRFLLDALPAQMHLVIATRADPPLRLARLRARGELAELRLADLRFSAAEAAIFLNRSMGLGLSEESILTLAGRTEGWAAGLQMAAISLRGAGDREAFIRTFSGNNRYILDFLAEEIFQQQPESIRTFLLKTSILDRLTSDLCAAVTDQVVSQSLPTNHQPQNSPLEYLEQSNLFVIPLDDERLWYRYHQLFRDYLRKRLGQVIPNQVAGLHRKASDWFDANGDPGEAIEHALAARDFDRAAGLVERSAESTLMRSQVDTFLGWANRLPRELVHSRPDLELAVLWAMLLTDNSIDRIETALAAVQRSSPVLQGKSDVLQGYLLYLRGEVPAACDLLQQGFRMLPESERLFRTVAGWLLSISHVTFGDFSAGERSLEETVRTSLEQGNLMVATGALCQLAEIHVRRAQLRQARQDYERALSLSTDVSGSRLPIASIALIGLGELAWETGDLDSALNLIREGIALTDRLHASMALGGLLPLSRILQASGDLDGADLAIGQAMEVASASRYSILDDLAVMGARALLWIRRGDLQAAGAWVRERGLGEDFDPSELDDPRDFTRYHLRKYELLIAARWWIATGRPKVALALLDPLRMRMETQGRIRMLIEATVLAALAYHSFADLPEALAALGHALALAEPEGYVRVFLDEGEPMRCLLHEAAHAGVSGDFALRLIRDLQGDQAADSSKKRSHSGGQLLPEPLSEREIELLRLIAAGLSNQEIAARLFISLPTVKWHTGNIFGKLGVHSRTQALAKAGELGILDGE